MNLAQLLKLVSIAPIIAYGVQAIKADCSIGDKHQAAQDALNVSIVTAQQAFPNNQADVTAAGNAAQDVLTTLLNLLHKQGTPATPPAAA